MRSCLDGALIVLLAAGLAAAAEQPVSTHAAVVELCFPPLPAAGAGASPAAWSIAPVAGAERLYLMTHQGERADAFAAENQQMIDHPLVDDPSRYCSVFSATTGHAAFLGRNFDNANVGAILVTLYRPPRGYASVSFSRAVDVGLGQDADLARLDPQGEGRRLLLAPFYATDGFNERGVAASLAGVRAVTHEQRGERKPVFVTYLLRQILDRAANVDEACALVEQYAPFDVDVQTLNTHYFVADATGRSCVLEYAQDRWWRTPGNGRWQAVTNKPVTDVPDSTLRDQCGRYRTICADLERGTAGFNWERGLRILREAQQQGTTWSAVYALSAREIFWSVHRRWDIVYRVRAFE
jgi:hypothetical protein